VSKGLSEKCSPLLTYHHASRFTFHAAMPDFLW
jgi:hypothetical protein